jgi:hypothetical protein
VGATLLGAFMGRKAMSISTIGRASTAIGRAGRSMEQAGDIERAYETIAEYQRLLDDLNAQLKIIISSKNRRGKPFRRLHREGFLA